LGTALAITSCNKINRSPHGAMELTPREKDKLLIFAARWSPNVAGPAV
jgi:hypothetical protein